MVRPLQVVVWFLVRDFPQTHAGRRYLLKINCSCNCKYHTGKVSSLTPPNTQHNHYKNVSHHHRVHSETNQNWRSAEYLKHVESSEHTTKNDHKVTLRACAEHDDIMAKSMQPQNRMRAVDQIHLELPYQ